MTPAASIIVLLRTDIIVLMASFTLLMKCIKPFDDYFPLFLLAFSLMTFSAGIRVRIIVSVCVVTINAGQPVSFDRRVPLMIE